MRKFLLCVLSACVLTACTNSDEKESERVAELVDFEPSVKFEKVWSSSVGSGQGKYARFVPAIDRTSIYAADAEGRVFAFDLESGKRLWKTETDLEVSGAVGAGYGVVLVGSFDAEILALSSESGEQLWSASVTSEIVAPPATNGDIAVVQTIDGRVFAFDLKTGEQRWSYDHVTPVLSLRGTAAPVLTATQVICAFDNGQILSFSSSDGTLGWEARVAQPKGRTDLERIVDIDGTPLVNGGLVYVSSYQGNVLALSRGQGSPLWNRAISSYRQLASSPGKIFASDDRSGVMALNSANGDLIWHNQQLQNRGATAPVVIDGYVAVIDREGYMHVMSQADGAFAARFKPKGEDFNSPVVSHNKRLYVLSGDGKLSVYQIKSNS